MKPVFLESGRAPTDHEWTTCPGYAMAIIERGEITFCETKGLANVEHGSPNTPCTAFGLGSLGKQFIAIAVALLVRRDRLSLSAAVRQFVPELPSYGRDDLVTVAHLIYHTSGIRDYRSLIALAARSEWSCQDRDELFRLLLRQRRLNFAPGTWYSYSNSGYLLLATIIERLTGETLAAFLTRELFAPLGMAHTFVDETIDDQAPGRALGYELTTGGWTRCPAKKMVAGPGGIWSSVEDLCRWENKFTDGRLGELSAQLAELVYTPGRLSDGTVLDYACGIQVRRHRGVVLACHGGVGMGYRHAYISCLERPLAALVLSNAPIVDPFHLAFSALCEVGGLNPTGPTDPRPCFKSSWGNRPADLPGDIGDSYDGHYRSDELDVTHELCADGGTLLMRHDGTVVCSFTRRNPDYFVSPTGRWWINGYRNEAHEVVGFSISDISARDVEFTRI